MPMTSPPTPPRRCTGPHRALEATVWAAAMDLDTAVALGRAHATRPAPTPAEAHDLVAALATTVESLTTVMRQASGDVAALAVMPTPDGAALGGPVLDIANRLDGTARLLEVLADDLAAATAEAATLAGVRPFPSHADRPVPGHRPMRIVAVVA